MKFDLGWSGIKIFESHIENWLYPFGFSGNMIKDPKVNFRVVKSSKMQKCEGSYIINLHKANNIGFRTRPGNLVICILGPVIMSVPRKV
jgi:hypothetical protein